MAAPRLINAVNRPFPVTVEVHFDTVMSIDDALIDPDNYTFNRGAFATTASPLNEKQVILTVENLFEYDTFTVTIDNVVSVSGDPLDPDHNSYTFPLASRPNVDESVKSISATNGRLKTGIQVLKIEEDEDRWYVMTESGLDVINKTSLANEGFVLDGYGFNTIFVG